MIDIQIITTLKVQTNFIQVLRKNRNSFKKPSDYFGTLG